MGDWQVQLARLTEETEEDVARDFCRPRSENPPRPELQPSPPPARRSQLPARFLLPSLHLHPPSPSPPHINQPKQKHQLTNPLPPPLPSPFHQTAPTKLAPLELGDIKPEDLDRWEAHPSFSFRLLVRSWAGCWLLVLVWKSERERRVGRKGRGPRRCCGRADALALAREKENEG